MIRCMRAAFWFGEHDKKFLKVIEHENRFGLTQIHMVSVAPAQFDCVATSEDNEVVKNSVVDALVGRNLKMGGPAISDSGLALEDATIIHLTIRRTRLPTCGVIPLLRTSLTFEDVRPISRGSGRDRGRSICEPIATLSLVFLRPSHGANAVEVESEQTEWCLGLSCDRDEANTQRRNPSSYSCMRTLSITRKTAGSSSSNNIEQKTAEQYCSFVDNALRAGEADIKLGSARP